MSRVTPDGVELSWWLAGMESMISAGLPFFIEWDIDPANHPARSNLSQAGGATSVQVQMSGDRDELGSWVPDASGVTVQSGETGLKSVLVAFGDVEVHI